MNRTEVIFDLARFSHPTWYHSLLSWSTPRLKALLMFYREDAREGTNERFREGNPTRNFLGSI